MVECTVKRPTKQELWAIDKQLSKSDDAETRKLTMARINKHDARWRRHNASLPSWMDEPIDRSITYGEPIHRLRKIACRILHGQKKECMLWFLDNPGITRKAIGDELGISKDAVRSHISRGIAQMLKNTDFDDDLWDVLMEVFGAKVLTFAGYYRP